MFGCTSQSVFSSTLLMQVSRILPIDSAFSLIRNHIHKFILNCDAQVPFVGGFFFFFCHCVHSFLELNCLVFDVLIQYSIPQFLQVSYGLSFYYIHMYISPSIKLRKHICVFTLSISLKPSSCFSYIIYLNRILARTGCSKYNESISTILNVLGSPSSVFWEPRVNLHPSTLPSFTEKHTGTITVLSSGTSNKLVTGIKT